MAQNTTAAGKSINGQPEPGDDKGRLLGGNGVDDGAAHQARHLSWTDTGTHGSGMTMAPPMQVW